MPCLTLPLLLSALYGSFASYSGPLPDSEIVHVNVPTITPGCCAVANPAAGCPDNTTGLGQADANGVGSLQRVLPQQGSL